MTQAECSCRGDRLHEVSRAYQDAFTHLEADLAAAATRDAVRQILQNERAAEAAFLEAAQKAFDANGAEIENAFKAATAANDAIAQARQRTEAFEHILGLLTAATQAATKLVALA